jgi:hypothetical protein
MDSDTKREVAEADVADAAPGDNTTRARNRTVMLTPEMTGTVRARLGGEAPGEIFEPRGVLGEPDAGLSADWETSELEGASDSVVLGYSEASENSLGVRGWDSNDAAEQFEPQSPFFLDEDSSAVDAAQSFESSRWDEPAPVAREESRIITPARIVRSASSSREAHPQTDDAELGQLSVNDSSEQEAAYVSEGSVPSRPDPGISRHFERMVPTPELEPSKHEQIFWKSPSQLVGFLVSYDYDPLGSYVELRKGRLLVSSDADTSGNCLVVAHETVSPMHAIMRIAEGGAVQVLDQLSEYGTRIVRGGGGQDAGEELLLSGDKASIRNGDVLSFGERKFHVCLVTTG